MRDAKLFNDQVHGYIRMSPTCVSIIDTPQFQRLRDLKQLGTLYYVFPGASHNRFEHSLGVAHLAGETVARFQSTQPELDLSARDIDLLSVAGLAHDLGHGPFSHVFDAEFMPAVRPGSDYTHEAMSLRMFEFLIDDNHIDMERNDMRFVQELINGAKAVHGNTKRLDDRGYLYEIVANGRNCIDVDKFDYLARDMQNLFGGKKGYNYSRLWHYNRVIDNEICYHASVTSDIYELFDQRYYMHKQIYGHRKGKAVEYMMCDAMVLADKTLGISASTESPEDFQYMTDHIVKMIECSKDPALQAARDIVRRIRRRELYEFVDEYLVPSTLTNAIPKVRPADIACAGNASGIDLNVDDIIVYDGKLNYNLKDKNPVDMVSFYTSSNYNEKFHTPKQEVSLLFPEKFEERILRVYSRTSDKAIEQAISVPYSFK
ncbi:hypothetical protein SDRG_09750 [Saprolegnia diclina VS20]|uniref:HD/PDEase domain-containing protein n=1 Tax=Saprolegnia diclina (strain VS20) TaxID=1156394 RepID=T0Q4L8_SAPDV|nr:hypothetical protein SDRG_09750 [Saprolegnia diclina VS20]EQC32779.1 hypothetical protein SDRG_09750 [Saprolegnia diclina VS20]|eukprot:XP_008613923.1 hypothetical protein SDRG_09750 [Saprolegnia diclina VS20]